MDVVEYILDGLEAALELERELGVRTVEIDRALLAESKPGAPRLPAAEARLRSKVLCPSGGGPETKDLRREPPAGLETRDARRDTGAGLETRDARQGPVNQTIKQSNNQTILPLVFLHDRPLAPEGVEMMAKILNAMGKPDAPIVVTSPVPKAKVTVVLGGLALRKHFPGMRGEPGQWQRTPDGRHILITYSPAYILRFKDVTPAVKKIKEDMWRSLKAVRQRLGWLKVKG